MKFMTMKNMIFFILCCMAISLQAQTSGMETNESVETVIDEIANSITVEDLKKHLSVLAADDMEGRELGYEGNRMAARYIAEEFKKMGIDELESGGYFQPIPFYSAQWKELKLEVNGKEYSPIKEFYSIMSMNNSIPRFETDEVIFLGYGIDDPAYSDYKGADVQGKVILIYRGEPKDAEGNSLITKSPDVSAWSRAIIRKLRTARDKGVKAVLIIDDEFTKNVGELRNLLLGGNVRLGEPGEMRKVNYTNQLFINTDIFSNILGKKRKKVIKVRDKIAKKGKSKAVAIPTNLAITQIKDNLPVQHENVLAYIEGSDPELKNEVIVITAHYDHVGRRGDDIFNGADDDGSGTVSVMEIAEAFQKAKEMGAGPKRSVLCMLVTGEEKGLLGSKYYTENPIYPLEQTVVNINIDMIGRIDDKHASNPDYVYVIGSDMMSDDLHTINDEVNATYTQLELDYTYNAVDDPNRFFYRSDHFNFAIKGIPAIFFFNGTHADYHRPSDTIEKINFEVMRKRALLAFYNAWEIANREERLSVDRLLKQ